MLYLGIFRLEYENMSLSYWNQRPRIGLSAKFGAAKQKSLNLERKMSDLDIFGLEVENNFVIIEISTLEFF